MAEKIALPFTHVSAITFPTGVISGTIGFLAPTQPLLGSRGLSPEAAVGAAGHRLSSPPATDHFPSLRRKSPIPG